MLNSSCCFKTKPEENSREFYHHQGDPWFWVPLILFACFQVLLPRHWSGVGEREGCQRLWMIIMAKHTQSVSLWLRRVAGWQSGSGGGGGGSWWPGKRARAVCDSSPGRDHLSAPVATVCKILARFSNSLTSNLMAFLNTLWWFLFK